MTKAEIVEAMQEALGNHPCRYTSLTPQQLDHLVGMVADIGDGDLRRGVEIVRVNHKWVMARAEADRDAECSANHELISSIRRGLGRVGGHVAKSLAWALIAGLCFLVWLGIKVKLFE